MEPLFFNQTKYSDNLQDIISVFNLKTKSVFRSQAGLEDVASWGAKYFLYLLQNKRIFSDNAIYYCIEEIKATLKILPHYEQQLSTVLDILVEFQLISPVGKHIYQLQQRNKLILSDLLAEKALALKCYPELKDNIDFFHTVIERYLLILSGEKLFMEILFSDSSFSNLTKLYKNNPVAKYYNSLTSHAIICFIKNFLFLPQKQSISILEIGAGIGATTEQVLLLLNEYKDFIQYHYTDISNAFLRYGYNQFQEKFSCIKFSKFDINLPPEEQGLKGKHYNIILATNAIHNARNIEKVLTQITHLLRPDGILVLNEAVAKSNYSTFIYGLLADWWKYNDVTWRIPGTPLINSLEWQKIFSAYFSSNLSINKLMGAADLMGQDVLLALEPKHTEK